jgi:hypothetical protein
MHLNAHMTSLKKDKDRILRVAELIYTALHEQGHGPHIRGNGITRPVGTWTDGWKLRLGSLGLRKPSLELWLDRYPARDRRCFWWGVYSANPEALPWLMKQLPRSLKPTMPVLTINDYEKVGPSSWLLKHQFTRKEFAQPIEERYRVDRYYGVYDSTPTSDQIIAGRAVDFFARILCHLYGTAPVANDIATDNLPARVEQSISRIVRDTEISLEIKKLYGYRCQVCGKRLEVEPGLFYAEAHHLKPLGGEHKGPDVRGNLLCLCPNHHALFDYFAMPLDPKRLKLNKHKLGQSFVDYHNARANGRAKPDTI